MSLRCFTPGGVGSGGGARSLLALCSHLLRRAKPQQEQANALGLKHTTPRACAYWTQTDARGSFASWERLSQGANACAASSSSSGGAREFASLSPGSSRAFSRALHHHALAPDSRLVRAGGSSAGLRCYSAESGDGEGGKSGSLFDKLSNIGRSEESKEVSPASPGGGGYDDPRVYKLNEGEHVQITKPQDFAKCVLRQAPIGPRKLKRVCNMLRGMSVEEALLQCRLSVKKGAKLCEQAILSARANAVHNHALDGKKLYVDQIFSTKGQYRKRVDFVAKGRSVIKKKYFSHLTVILKEGKPQKVKIQLGPSAMERRARRMTKWAPALSE